MFSLRPLRLGENTISDISTNPHFSPGGEMITQRFEFTKDFAMMYRRVGNAHQQCLGLEQGGQCPLYFTEQSGYVTDRNRVPIGSLTKTPGSHGKKRSAFQRDRIPPDGA